MYRRAKGKENQFCVEREKINGDESEYQTTNSIDNKGNIYINSNKL